MEPARSIGTLGFRRWYERQLIEAHAWLVTCLLCGIGISVALEGISFRKPFFEFAPVLGFLFVGGLVCWHAFTRFRVLLEEAHRYAEHSTCEACGAYGSFSVLQEYQSKLRVSCRKCSHVWLMG